MSTAEVEADINRVRQTIRTTEIKEFYNNIILQHPTLADIDSRISVLRSSVESTLSELQSPNALFMPLEEMVVLENRYTNTVRELNSLLQTREVVLGAPVIEPDYDLQLLYQEQDELMKKLSESVTYVDIGDISYYPVTGIEYKVTSNFGSRWDPVTQKSYSYHSGIDLRSPMRTPIGAWFTGFVYKCGWDDASGYYIWLDHGDGVRTFYCHLAELKVTKGQQVKQGEIIALSGNTGYRTTGPHLHLGLYLDGTAVDPQVVLEHD